MSRSPSAATLAVALALALLAAPAAAETDPREILDQVDDLFRGDVAHGEMAMRPPRAGRRIVVSLGVGAEALVAEAGSGSTGIPRVDKRLQSGSMPLSWQKPSLPLGQLTETPKATIAPPWPLPSTNR